MSETQVLFNPNGTRAQVTPAPTADAVRHVASLDLLGTRGELMIEHHGRLYRLRVTQNDKLILTA